MKNTVGFIPMLLLACASLPLVAHNHEGSKDVVSERERAVARELGSAGPTETKGIGAMLMLGATTLGADFPALEGRSIRIREIELLPGGVVAVHKHELRPGVAYVLEGELVEHRNDSPEPIVRRKGDVAFEKTGVIHWWENLSDAPARVLVVDIVAE